MNIFESKFLDFKHVKGGKLSFELADRVVENMFQILLDFWF